MDVFRIKVSSLLLKLRVIEHNKTCSVTPGLTTFFHPSSYNKFIIIYPDAIAP